MFRRRPFAAVLTLALVAPVTALATSAAASAAPSPTAKQVDGEAPAAALPRPAATRVPTTRTRCSSSSRRRRPRPAATWPLQSRGGRMPARRRGHGLRQGHDERSRPTSSPSGCAPTRRSPRSRSTTCARRPRHAERLRPTRLPRAGVPQDRPCADGLGPLEGLALPGRRGHRHRRQRQAPRPRRPYRRRLQRDHERRHRRRRRERRQRPRLDGRRASSPPRRTTPRASPGVAWNAKVMPVKVLDSHRQGHRLRRHPRASTGPSDHGARIVNLSLGGDPTTARHCTTP